MRYLSVCSGIEAATQAWHPLSWTPVAFSEIEPFPCAVLAHHYPTVPNWGDMTRYEDWPDADVDVLCGGTPCQSFSIAGLRKGLADPRGNLMLTFGAIAGRYRPRWLVWENVPGVLSSNGGRDFGAFLGMLGELGYGFAYRVLDAQHVRTRRFPHAVPQRRRRVWVVAYLGDWRRAAAVLFDRESLSGHPAPRREAGQGFAADVAQGVALRGREGGGTAELTGPIATALRASTGGGDKPHVMCANSGDVGYCLTASAQQSLDAETETLVAVAHALRGEGLDASEDGSGRGTPIVPVAFDLNQITSPTNRSQPTPGLHHTLPATSCPPHLATFGLTTEQTPKFAADHALTLTKQSPTGGGQIQCAVTASAVRRLTPRECERLQGFPDDFTRIPYRGKPADACPDGPRYKALGNSWAVNCADWIGERIAIVDQWRTA